MLKYHGIHSFLKRGVATLKKNIGPAIVSRVNLSKLDVVNPTGNAVNADALVELQCNIVIVYTDNEVNFGAIPGSKAVWF